MIQELTVGQPPDLLSRTSDPERRLRVAYIVGSLGIGGAEGQVLELIRGLDRVRFSPSLVVLENVEMQRTHESMSETFTVGIPQGGNSAWITRSVSFVSAIRKICHQFKRWRSDLVHAFLPAPSILGGVAARMAGVPVVIGSRRSLASFYRHKSRGAGWADSVAFRVADLNLANSSAVAREMIEFGGCPPAKCQILYNGVDTHRFYPSLSRTWRSEQGWSSEHIVFGLIGSFRPCKRHADFVQAAALISEKCAHARFVMVGADYGTRTDVIRLVTELGLQQKVVILDADPQPEKIFAAMDVYISTSATEGFSNVLLEAMACGKPVIATRVGGNTEAIQENQSGFLVPVASPESIAEAASILLDQDRRNDMGACGRRLVEENFSIERMIRDHEQLYLALIAKHARQHA